MFLGVADAPTDRSPAHCVTRIGKAAHTSFVGEDVSAAARGAFLLAAILEKHGVGAKTVEEYGKEIFPCAIGARSGKVGFLVGHWLMMEYLGSPPDTSASAAPHVRRS